MTSTTSSSLSPWQALLHTRHKTSGATPPQGSATFAPPTAADDRSGPDGGTDGATDAIGATAASGSTDLSSTLTQLIAGLQSFLLNLQSTGDTSSASATTAANTVAAATTTATPSIDATATTDTAATTDTSLLTSLEDFLTALQDNAANRTGDQRGIDR